MQGPRGVGGYYAWLKRQPSKRAVANQNLLRDIQRIHHSDRGSQYASGDYRNALNSAGIIPSMSRKGNCWDNAPMESFFHTLKTELVYHRTYATKEEAKRDLFQYIEGYYNRQRIHSAIGYLTPEQMELKAA